MVEIHKIDTTDPRDVERFIQFPFRLYRDCPQWVPPVVSSVRKQLDRNRHPFYSHSNADFYLALQAGEVVGRIAALEPRKRNAHRDKHGAFFYMIETVEDTEVARALFASAFEWARDRGLEAISGPDGFLAGDGLGILVKGFEHRPAMGIPYNHSYYDGFVKDSGFRKQTDYNSAYLPGDFLVEERIRRIVEKVKERRGFRVLRFRSKDELRAIAPKLIDAYNAAFAENREFVPIAGRDAERIAQRLIDMTRPELVIAVVKGEEIAGFGLGFPDVSAALQRCRGRIYPLGWARLLLESRRTRWINMNGGGTLPKYQGLGVDAIMFCELHRIIQEYGFQHIDVVQINEQNTRMKREAETLGADWYKTHRIYEREL